MKKIFYVLILSIGIISCEKENIDNEFPNKSVPNKDTLEKNSSTTKYWTDITGRIEIIEVYDKVYSTDPTSSSNIDYISHTTKVPNGYVCIEEPLRY